MLDLIHHNTPAFLDLLTHEVSAKLKKAATIIKYGDGQIIHSRGEIKPGLSIVRSGIAQVGIYGIDGTFVMTAVLGPGECFGEFTLFTGLPRTHDISAAGETEVYQLSSARFNRLYEQELSLSRALLKTTLVRTHLLLEMLDAIRRLPILERCAKILLTMSYTSRDPRVLLCRQSELAFTLGVSRVSLSKGLKKLTELGLIELGYRQIKIPNPEKLENWVAQHCNLAPLG